MSEATEEVLDIRRRALWLSLFTVAYNMVEGLVSVFFAVLSGSPALLGFGTDSFVESLSGAVMVWRFWHPQGAHKREHRAAVLVGASLLVLAAYITYEAFSTLVFREEPQRSLAAILIAAVSLVAMPMLFLAKHRAAHAVASGSLLADAKQTLACCLLSVALLVGCGLNYLFGWWQADPLASLFIALFLVREGYRALTTREVCTC